MVGGEGPTKNERSKQQNSKQQTPKSEAASAGRQPVTLNIAFGLTYRA